MNQVEYLAAIDEFSEAAYDLASGAPKAKKVRLKAAVRDLMTALATQATAQSLGAFGLLLAKLERAEERLTVDEERLTDLEERSLDAREAEA